MEFNRPANLKLTGNLNDNFKIFKQEVEVYFMATETNSKSQEVQVARLLNLLGPDGLKLYNTFKIDVVTVDSIFKSLEEYCVPRKNEVMEHYKYFTRKQAEGEPFDKFYADLRELIKSCSFGESEEALLRTQVVLGINDKDLQSKLLREDLPLLKVIKYCQVVEQAEANCRLVQKENLTVDQVEKSRNWRFKSKEASKTNNQHNATKKYEKGKYSESNQGKSNNADYKDQVVELDNADLYVPVDPNKIPKFLNKPSTYQVVTKDTIVLPCEVYNPENFVLAWKKGIAILTAGTTKVTPEERIRIVEGYNLEIRNVQINDAGNYICQIGTLEPVELKHTLQILIPPRIIGITSNGKVSAKKGSDVTLQCNSTGNPPPTITWSRKNNMLPNGEKTFIGNSYTIDSVRRQADGVYICTASNNIGTTVNEEIDLNILYPPEVKEEQSIVFTVEGQETEIVCIVHAEPKADVLWYRDTLQLDMTEWRITDVRGNRYTLRLRKVQKTDFGNYSCVADNGLGKSKRFIEVTGRPDVAVITSSKQGRSKNSYEMLWTVKSYSPIIEYKVLYRPDKTNKSNQEIQYKRPMRRWNDDWTELLLNPASTDQLEKTRTETIRDLEPGTKYEATVQSRNRYGWSEVSQSFFFTTSTKNEAHPGNSVYSDPELRDMSITAINNKAVPMIIHAPLLCIMAIVNYYLA